MINYTTKKQNLAEQTAISEDGNIVKNPDVPHRSVNYFSKIANKLVSDIPPVDVNAESYLNNPNNSSFFMSPVISQEVKTAIQNLKNNGSGLHKI